MVLLLSLYYITATSSWLLEHECNNPQGLREREKDYIVRRKYKKEKRSKREGLPAVHVEFPRRSQGKKKGPRNRHPRLRKTKGNGKGTKQRC